MSRSQTDGLNNDRHPELPTGMTDPPRMKVCSPFRGWVGILFSLSYEEGAKRPSRRMPTTRVSPPFEARFAPHLRVRKESFAVGLVWPYARPFGGQGVSTTG